MTDQTKTAVRPWRRFLRFSVRGIIVLVLVIGAGLGWLVHSVRIQREAVAAIRRANGKVFYNWQWTNGSPVAGGEPRGPRWMVKAFGVDYFNSVVSVVIPVASDDDLIQIGKLGQLRDLLIVRSDMTDAGLAHLKGLTRLNHVGLGHTHVTDAGLTHLKGLMQLSGVDLRDTRVTDAGLMDLKGLTNLSSLVLDGTQVSDHGLAHLKVLTNLGSLSLSGTRVSDAGLPHLTGLVQLSVLWLNDTHVTDAGIRKLKQALPSLTIYH